MIHIFVDGSCKGNPGPGGFGVVICQGEWGDNPKDYKIINAYQERCSQTTNNREEMKAIIWTVENCGEADPIIYSDSAYCVNTFSKWMYGWRDNGWKRPKNQPVENLDLVQKYYALSQTHNITLMKVPGHSGVLYNELADQLATGKITTEEVMNKYG